MLSLSALYAIIDKTSLDARGLSVDSFASELRDAGIRLIQYRDKAGAPQQILRAAAQIAAVFASTDATLLLNDRAGLALLAGFHGVHVGQHDLSPADARRVLGASSIVGVSTHDDAQLRAANTTSADYLAIGPVFATSSKLNSEPVIGLEGVRRARALTHKPLVAIGGINRANARSVLDAGADSLAVIGAFFAPGETVAQVARDFLEILR